MWLINTKSFELEFYIPPKVPEYAILSHTWGTDEVTFQDFQDLEKAETKKGFLKIKMTCQLAQNDKIGYAWVDTCCIDKTSSAELSESINSMYSWYQRAKICYAYIGDWSPGFAWTDLRSIYEEDGSDEDASEGSRSVDDRPEEDASDEDASEGNLSVDDQSEENASDEDASEGNRSVDDRPKEDASDEDASEGNQSVENRPKEYQSEECQSEDYRSEYYEPEEYQLEEYQSEKYQSEEDQSEEDQSEEDQSEEGHSEQGRLNVAVSSNNGFLAAIEADLGHAISMTNDPNYPCSATSSLNRNPSSSKAPLRWFTRGWTLQELIAPTIMEFYDNNWNPRGSKSSSSVIENLSRITGISSSILKNGSEYNLREICLGQRMSWAAHRETSREEDIAYSLLGIFQINMPLLYGEGQKAFFRLQEEILKSSTDLSILAWRQPYWNLQSVRGIFSHHPDEFKRLRNCRLETSQFSIREEIVMTNKGARVQTSLFSPPTDDIYKWSFYGVHFMYLGCFVSDHLQGIFLKKMKDSYVRAEPQGLVRISASMRRDKAQTIYLARDMDRFSARDYDAALNNGLRVQLRADKPYVLEATESWPVGLYDDLDCTFLTRDIKSTIGYLTITIMSTDHTSEERRQVNCFMAVCRTFRVITEPHQQEVSVHLLIDTQAENFAKYAKSTSDIDPVTAEHNLFTLFESSSKHWGQEMVVEDASNGSLLRIRGELIARKRTGFEEHEFSLQAVKISLKVD